MFNQGCSAAIIRCLGIWLVLLGCVHADQQLADQPLVCRWATEAPKIDGIGDDGTWKQAVSVANFRLPGTGAKPQSSTVAKLLWDRQYLYFLAELEDHDLFANVVEHDGKTWEDDVFEMFLKPSESKTGYYEFQVNAAGTQMDMFIPQRKSGAYNEYKSANAFHWNAAVERNGSLQVRTDRDSGWTVEGRIPWVDLLPTGGRPDIDEVWGIALCRYDYSLDREPELSSCAPLSQVDFHRTEDYAKVRFAGPAESSPSAAALAKRKNRLTTQVHGSPEPPLPYRAVRAYPHLKLEWPVDVQVEPGAKRFVIIEESGPYGPTQIRRSHEDPNVETLSLIAAPGEVAYSIAFHPQFQSNGFMYVGSNYKPEVGGHRSRVVRYALNRASPDKAVEAPVTILEWDSNGHNGAAITFGLDGMMYVTSGDGTSDSDQNNAGQNLSHLLSKVLRIDVDNPEPGKTYSVPKDNPFVGWNEARPETWAYGLRNPWRITTDQKTGQIWVGNNGQDMFEQVYLLERGANYGWSVFEGSNPFYPNRTLGPTPHINPTVEHPHSESRSLTGGVVYYGKRLPELVGAYIYGDYSTGKIWGIKHDGKTIQWQREIADTTLQISSITLDHEGELIVVDHRGDKQGGLYHLEPNTMVVNDRLFPTKLSETGLFEDIRNHKMADGVVSYSVNAPFWSDNAIKSRFIALPESGMIQYADQWSWDFPESTVIVKSFQLELQENVSDSRRWVETRLMTKQQGEWVGYSYAWNEDQTDATLVESPGKDQWFAIQSASGAVQQQKWRYPSRTECMVCHTRAARYVLGLSTLQMNRLHDYGDGMVMNQLEAFETMRLFQADWVEKAKSALRNELSSHGMSKEVVDKELSALKVSADQLPVRSKQFLGQSCDKFESLVDPYDPNQVLEKRARSFLHSNCAYCHVESGGGNAQIDLAYWTPKDKMRLLGVPPIHHHFDLEKANLVAPGSPDLSVLLCRVGTRETGKMPPIGSNVVDDRAVGMLREWINSLK